MREVDEEKLAEAREQLTCKVDFAAMAAAGGADVTSAVSSCSSDSAKKEKKPVRLTEMTTAGG